MALEPIALPPGIYRNGTQLQSKGRWYNCNLIRFFQNTILPHLGWRAQSTSTITGKGRAIISWHDNSSNTWSAVGTESHLYVMTRGGVVSDITPVGFVSGRADAVSAGGYGDGLYGAGIYGVPIPDDSAVQDASMWSLDTFGQYLVGVMSDDGTIYQWTLSTGTPAAVITPASGSTVPSAVALLTTAEGMLMALGAGNNPRLAQWSGQQDDTIWTPTTTNQAGDFQLGTNGRLMTGVRIKGANLIFSDVDVWTATYQADEFVYGFKQVGAQGCGIISRGAAMPVDAVATAYGAQAVWMGQNNFWMYNGYVLPLQCEVWDYVFNNLNTLQKSKITCEMTSAYGEITWRYPSLSSTEIDSYVTWNFRENHWTVGQLVRLSGTDAGVNAAFPLRVGNDGNIYEHEVGFAYGGAMPFLESGPFELGAGDRLQDVTQLLPDDQSIGSLAATFYTKFTPSDSEVTWGPYTLAPYTDTRFSGRQFRARFDAIALTNWRLGLQRVDVQPGSGR